MANEIIEALTYIPTKVGRIRSFPEDQGWENKSNNGRYSIVSVSPPVNRALPLALLIRASRERSVLWSKTDFDHNVIPFCERNWKLSMTLNIQRGTSNEEGNFIRLAVDDGETANQIKIYVDGYQLNDLPRVTGFDFRSKERTMSISINRGTNQPVLEIDGEIIDQCDPASSNNDTEVSFGIFSSETGHFIATIKNVTVSIID